MTAPTMIHPLVGQHPDAESLQAAGPGSSFYYLNARVTYVQQDDGTWLRTNQDGETRTLTTETMLERGRHGDNYTWTNYVEATPPTAGSIGATVTPTMVGQQITRDTVRSAPEGAAFASPNGRRIYTKTRADVDGYGTWEVDGDLYGWDNDVCRNLVRDGARWTVWPGDGVGGGNLPAVGDQVTTDGLTALPVGSIISDRTQVGAPVPARSWRKSADGWRHHTRDEGPTGVPVAPGHDAYASLGFWFLHTIGTGEVPATAPAPQFQVDQVVTPEMRESLPVGTVVVYQHQRGRADATDISTKRADGTWYPNHLWSLQVPNGEWFIHSLPDATPALPDATPALPDGITIGMVFNPRDPRINDMPVGSRISYQDYLYERTEQGWYYVTNGAVTTRRFAEPVTGYVNFTSRGNTLVRYGPETPATETPAEVALPFVGTQLDHARMDALPDGSVIEYMGGAGTQFRKASMGYWVRLSDSREFGQHRLTSGRYQFVRGPVETPVVQAPVPVVPPGCVDIGQQFSTVAQVAACPVGTKITRLNHDDGRRFLWKVGGNSWTDTGPDGAHVWVDSQIGRNYHRVASYPTLVSPEQVAAVTQVQTEARAVINQIIQANPRWAGVRDGVFRLLGIDPMPAIDTMIPWGSVFGLPVGSVVRATVNTRARLYHVTANNVAYPEPLAGDATVDGLTPETQVQVLALGTFTPPVFTGRNDFLRQLWAQEALYRGIHRWCSAVERGLNAAGLGHPGDAPDAVAVTDPLVPGYTFTNVHPGLTQADITRLSTLGLGSIITAPGIGPMVRTNGVGSGWAMVGSLREATLRGLQAVSIVSVV